MSLIAAMLQAKTAIGQEGSCSRRLNSHFSRSELAPGPIRTEPLAVWVWNVSPFIIPFFFFFSGSCTLLLFLLLFDGVTMFPLRCFSTNLKLARQDTHKQREYTGPSPRSLFLGQRGVRRRKTPKQMEASWSTLLLLLLLLLLLYSFLPNSKGYGLIIFFSPL